MASVTARRNPSGAIVWRVQFRIDGKSRQATFTDEGSADRFGNLVDRLGGAGALRVLERRQENINLPTLAEFTARYLDPMSGILTGIEPGTRDGYLNMAAHFLPILGDYPITEIDKDLIGQWVEWQERQPSEKFKGEFIAAKTVKNRHALLSNIFRVAVAKGLRPDNPAHGTRISEGNPREPVFLSRDEFGAIYEQIPDFYKGHVAFLIGSQARWSEATAALGIDLRTDTAPPTVRLNKAWKKNPDGPQRIGPTKTKRGKRTVSLWDELVELVGIPPTPDSYILRGKGDGRLWYGGFNARIWHPAVLRAGITSEPLIHDLRHTGASWLIADGKPLPFIQARLGHESIQTTINVYGHLLPDAHTQMADSLRGTMSNVLPLALKEISASTHSIETDDGSTITP